MSNPIDEAIRLGSEAEYILNSDVFKMAMEEIETDLTVKWAAGQLKDADEREDAFRCVQSARAFRMKLMSLLDGRRVAKDRIERDNKRSARHGQQL